MHRNEEEKAAAFAAGEKPPVTYKEFVQRRRVINSFGTFEKPLFCSVGIKLPYSLKHSCFRHGWD